MFKLAGSGEAHENGLVLAQTIEVFGEITMGRDKGLTNEQKNDFEVIRRKYRNVLDNINYDDLQRRLKVIRDHFKLRIKS